MAGIATTDLADLSVRNYIRFDSGVEKVPDTEAEDTQAIQDIFSRIIPEDLKAHGHTYPTTHARTLGVVKGKLVVSDNLPPHLKQGPFATSGEHSAVLRHSVNNHDVTADPATSIGRGLSIKIFNVPGERFPEGEGNETWDMTMNSQVPISELSDARVAREMITILEMGVHDPASVRAAVMKRKDLAVQVAPGMQPKRRAESMEYYSQYAYRMGDYVAKFGIFPITPAQHQIAAQGEPQDNTSAGLTRLMKEFYASNEAVYQLKFQLLENLDDQPVEYAGKMWDAHQYPYQTVGQFVFPKQDSYVPELIKFWEDNMQIDIWRSPKTVQPLGGANRVRRSMYPYSQELRWKLNPSPFIDVQKIEDLPGPNPL